MYYDQNGKLHIHPVFVVLVLGGLIAFAFLLQEIQEEKAAKKAKIERKAR